MKREMQDKGTGSRYALVDLVTNDYYARFQNPSNHSYREMHFSGVIKPLYKNKGDPTLPENYRPITILSCMGKLFTVMLNTRLNTFLEVNNILNETQCGFRASYSTTDNIFVIHALIEYLRVRKLKLFCAFIDFTKAFDNVWRVGLWGKLLSYNISGKILTIIKNMYSDIKSCLSSNGDCSDFSFTAKTA